MATIARKTLVTSSATSTQTTITKKPRKSASEVSTRGTQVRAHKTRDAILRAATKVFSKSGFADGRIESISKLSNTHDRMIYYYFGSKAQLFIEVLETNYQRMNEAESNLNINLEDPLAALTAIVDFVWHYYLEHPELITLLNSENLQRGKHIKKSARISELSSPAIGLLDQVLRTGVEKKLFRADIRARDLYIEIAALGYFYLSNRYTLSAFLSVDLTRKSELEHWQAFITDVTIRSVMNRQ